MEHGASLLKFSIKYFHFAAIVDCLVVDTVPAISFKYYRVKLQYFDFEYTHRLNHKLILNEIHKKYNLLLIIVEASVEAETSTIISKRLCFY